MALPVTSLSLLKSIVPAIVSADVLPTVSSSFICSIFIHFTPPHPSFRPRHSSIFYPVLSISLMASQSTPEVIAEEDPCFRYLFTKTEKWSDSDSWISLGRQTRQECWSAYMADKMLSELGLYTRGIYSDTTPFRISDFTIHLFYYLASVTGGRDYASAVKISEPFLEVGCIVPVHQLITHKLRASASPILLDSELQALLDELNQLLCNAKRQSYWKPPQPFLPKIIQTALSHLITVGGPFSFDILPIVRQNLDFFGLIDPSPLTWVHRVIIRCNLTGVKRYAEMVEGFDEIRRVIHAGSNLRPVAIQLVPDHAQMEIVFLYIDWVDGKAEEKAHQDSIQREAELDRLVDEMKAKLDEEYLQKQAAADKEAAVWQRFIEWGLSADFAASMRV
ncbi:hypothetical protein M422DRAFT_256473 [Sphaerobolus stellatus SS14]|uniref:Queuosine salvage protein n=1 Tax=Sphaerobolus stellatus (strain SS14) TaxID=990650 RepID=A0A0C9VRC7_SPHS4|nr:hypothetical protein M422DRAFT_256473 [Sphaerobolus stellatus SS14]